MAKEQERKMELPGVEPRTFGFPLGFGFRHFKGPRTVMARLGL